jgi:hypothetical protein
VIASAEEFVALRTSDDLGEQARATHEPAPEAVWLDVIARFPDMRPWVVHNKTVPLAILHLLADDPDPDVRWWVATKRKADSDLLDKLSRDPNDGVRARVACNRSTPLWLLERLAADPSEDVAEGARNQLAERAARRAPGRSG